jgi:hypothetical protein
MQASVDHRIPVSTKVDASEKFLYSIELPKAIGIIVHYYVSRAENDIDRLWERYSVSFL